MKPDTGRWPDIPAYIHGITRAIWEDRGLGGELARWYAPGVLVRAPTGLTTGNAGVAADTLATLHQFPDRQLLGEDVIFDDHGDGSFLSSHRLLSVMRHTGTGRFGTASGALFKSRIIADCVVRGGQVVEEWLVRDGTAFAAALGLTPRAFAERLAADDPGKGYFTPADDAPGAYIPRIAEDPAAAAIAAGQDAIWNRQHTAAIRSLYAPGAAVALPGNTAANGHAEIDAHVISWLAALPDARLTIHGITVNRAADAPVRIAIRWALDGTHTGWGRFGAPTGRPVHVMGLSHLHWWDGRIHAEWWLADEVAVWRQLLG